MKNSEGCNVAANVLASDTLPNPHPAPPIPPDPLPSHLTPRSGEVAFKDEAVFGAVARAVSAQAESADLRFF